MNDEMFIILRNSTFLVQCSLFIIFFSSCKYFKKENEEKPVARAYDQYLYAEELKSVLPENISAEDSIRIADNYISNWVKQKLLLKKAELNLSEEKKNVEKQLEDYRNSLILFLYEQDLVEQRLDTAVSRKEIEKYYEENKQNFELKENIVRVKYVKLDKQNKSVNKIKKWLNDDNADSRLKLSDYCSTQALQLSLDGEKWITPENLANETNIQQNKIEQMARYPNLYELDENTGYFIIKILEYQLKDDISPLSFEEKNIRNIIMNKRKLNLIEQLEKDVMTEGVAKNNYEIYRAKK